MEDTKIVHIMDIALWKFSPRLSFSPKKMKRIEGFGWSFGDGRYVRRSGKGLEACEQSTSVLDDQMFWRAGGAVRGLVEK